MVEQSQQKNTLSNPVVNRYRNMEAIESMGEATDYGTTRIGKWSFYAEDGSLTSTGYYENGKKSGVWTKYGDNKQPLSIIEFKNDMENGSYQSFYENGKPEIIGSKKIGEWDGAYQKFYKDGTLALSGNYVDGRADGDWTHYDESGKPYQSGCYTKGERNGLFVLYHKNSCRVEELITYKDGKRHGPYTYYALSGERLRRGNYVDNQKSGQWTAENSKLCTVSHVFYEAGTQRNSTFSEMMQTHASGCVSLLLATFCIVALLVVILFATRLQYGALRHSLRLAQLEGNSIIGLDTNGDKPVSICSYRGNLTVDGADHFTLISMEDDRVAFRFVDREQYLSGDASGISFTLGLCEWFTMHRHGRAITLESCHNEHVIAPRFLFDSKITVDPKILAENNVRDYLYLIE